MIQILKEELIGSLKMGYSEYKNCISNGSDKIDLAHVKGFCRTIEQILSVYGNTSLEEILEIKRPIIGDISLKRKIKESDDKVDYEIPTIFRKKSRKGQ